MRDLVLRLPDEQAINLLIIELKKKPIEEVEQLIHELLKSDVRSIRHSALKITQRIIRDRNVLLHILDLGLERKDVSDIQFWVAAIINGVGYKRLVRHLSEVATTHPVWVIYAWYQVAPLIRKNAPECLAALCEISSILDKEVPAQSSALQDYWEKLKVTTPLQ